MGVMGQNLSLFINGGGGGAGWETKGFATKRSYP